MENKMTDNGIFKISLGVDVVYESVSILSQIASVQNIADSDKGYAIYNQRISSVDENLDANYMRRLAVLRDHNTELDGLELIAISTDSVNDPITLDEPMGSYFVRLQNLLENMVVESHNKHISPTHVVKLRTEGLAETWAVLDRNDLVLFIDAKGKKALGSSGPVITGTIMTDEGIELIKRNLATVHGEQNEIK